MISFLSCYYCLFLTCYFLQRTGLEDGYGEYQIQSRSSRIREIFFPIRRVSLSLYFPCRLIPFPNSLIFHFSSFKKDQFKSEEFLFSFTPTFPGSLTKDRISVLSTMDSLGVSLSQRTLSPMWFDRCKT
jgi:hypothetical protein